LNTQTLLLTFEKLQNGPDVRESAETMTADLLSVRYHNECVKVKGLVGRWAPAILGHPEREQVLSRELQDVT